MADSVQRDKKMPAVQAANPASIAGAMCLATVLSQAAACLPSQGRQARMPIVHAKLTLTSVFAATWAGVDSIAYFTVKE